MLKVWLQAFRLRTLTLSLSGIVMGSFLASFFGNFNWLILTFAVLTTLFLQILSNLANDYGDFVNGADHDLRKGPKRAVSSGQISPQQMKLAVILFAILSMISGLLLIYFANIDMVKSIVFVSLGILAIIAAMKYTMGDSPYGYAGLGDISVFVFFGLLAVLGSFFLHTNSWNWLIVFPAISCGLFAVAVLNINNIRDIDSDTMAGKKSIPVRIGRKAAIIYHICLLTVAILSSVIFVFLISFQWSRLLFLLTIPMLIKNVLAVRNTKEEMTLDPYLKQMAITSLFFTLLFGIGMML